MTAEELKKLGALIATSRGEIKMSLGAKELGGVAKRHFRRVLRKYEQERAAG